MANAKPDDHGRYRVINSAGHEYSTYRYDKKAHKIAGGPASDNLGRALPPVHAGAEAPHVSPALIQRRVESQEPPEQTTQADVPAADGHKEA